jgi:hypothetical protein
MIAAFDQNDAVGFGGARQDNAVVYKAYDHARERTVEELPVTPRSGSPFLLA